MIDDWAKFRKKGYYIKKRRDTLIETIGDMSIDLKAVNTTKDNIQSSYKSDLSDVIVRIQELQEKLTDTILQLINYKGEIINAMDNLSDIQECDVMVKRYLDFKTWEDTADEMHMAIRTAQRVHGRALQHIRWAYNKK